MYTGLAGPSLEAPVTCGGSERWNVKVAKDADALTGKINLNADKSLTVADINQQVQPGSFDPAGRMNTEKKEYTVRGYLSYFTKEGDRDYHVVITQQPAAYGNGKTPAAGESVVVEFPDPSCFGGKPETQPHSSALAQSIIEARATFKDHIKGVSGDNIAKPIPVTVTGVGFFDRFTVGSHEPKGHSKVYALPDGRQVVLELHPVTEITFDNQPDNT
ncbi:MAG: hypothetical protein ACJ8FS_12530 [Sphingomicrobium sp.]